MNNDTYPRVSIVIPTYNRAVYLDDTLASARNQSYAHLDILVFDDGSTDHTRDVVEAHQREDRRVRYVRHDENKGLVGNWKYGISHVETDFFCLLGDDDTLEPTFVEELLRPLLEDPSLVLAFSDHWIIDEMGERLVTKSKNNTQRWRRQLLSRGRIEDFMHVTVINRSVFIGAVLFRRSAVSPGFIEEEVTSFVDAWILYGCAIQGAAYYVPERLVNCRWQEGGVSRSWKWRVYGYEGEVYYYRRLLDDQLLARYHDVFRVRLAEALAGLGSTYLLMGEHAKARDSFREARELYPGIRSRLGFWLTYGGAFSTTCLSALRAARNYFMPPGGPPIYPEEKVPESQADGENGASTKSSRKNRLEKISA